MSNFGIKMSKAGFDVGTATDFNCIFTSKRDIFKIYQIGTGSFSTGGTATISHSLGYSPSYLVYTSTDGTNYYLGGVNSSIGTGDLQITKELGSIVNQYFPQTANDYYSDFTNSHIFSVGQIGANGIDGAIRFPSVNETSLITKAEIGIYLEYHVGGNVKIDTYGINEDNTSDFGASPFGRTRTTNHINNTCDSSLTAGNTFQYDVTSIFNEITSRSGWSSGNAMGFLMIDDGNSGTNYISDQQTFKSFLKITKNNSPVTVYYKYAIFNNKLGTNTFA